MEFFLSGITRKCVEKGKRDNSHIFRRFTLPQLVHVSVSSEEPEQKAALVPPN